MKILATPAKKDLFLNFYLDEEFLSSFSSKPFRSFLHVYPTIYFDIDHNKKNGLKFYQLVCSLV